MDQQAYVREVLDANRYMVLGTTEDDGRPRVSPVFFTHHGYRTLFWVSGPDTTHSRNLVARPSVSIVVFDSSVEPGPSTAAVYLTGSAEQVPDGELAEECARAFRDLAKGGRPFAPGELSGDAPFRLYRAEADVHEIHVRGSHPELGTGVDRRVRVEMPTSNG